MYWQIITFVFIFGRYDVYRNRNCCGNFSSGFQQFGSRVASNQTHNPTFTLFLFHLPLVYRIHIWSTAFDDAETWALRKLDRK
jgi:hypothetical protein